MRTVSRFAIGVLAVGVAACGKHEFEPPDRAERVEHAEASYAPALFDSITWSGPEELELLGNQIYVDKCRNCHGPMGLGQTEYAAQRGLEVPSLVEPGWAKAHPDSIRRAVYVGHEEGMPVFGSTRLSLRDIEAVADYVLTVLRTEANPGS